MNSPDMQIQTPYREDPQLSPLSVFHLVHRAPATLTTFYSPGSSLCPKCISLTHTSIHPFILHHLLKPYSVLLGPVISTAHISSQQTLTLTLTLLFIERSSSPLCLNWLSFFPLTSQSLTLYYAFTAYIDLPQFSILFTCELCVSSTRLYALKSHRPRRHRAMVRGVYTQDTFVDTLN